MKNDVNQHLVQSCRKLLETPHFEAVLKDYITSIGNLILATSPDIPVEMQRYLYAALNDFHQHVIQMAEKNSA